MSEDAFSSSENIPEVDLASGIAAFESKNFAQAMRLLGPLAERGAVEAQYRLAIMHQVGLGVLRNESMAYKWMRLAADQGLALAEHGLGCMYLDGDCAQQDRDKAAMWLSKSAFQGLEGSKVLLEMMSGKNS